VHVLAVTGAERSPQFPDVPSMAEAGYPDVNVHLWSGVFTGAATPPAIARRLAETLRQAIAAPDVSEKLEAMAVNPGGVASSEEFRHVIEQDIKSYRAVVKAANLTFED
jgi:tripartite-type tricarboxylate transporter receptor subunit TctC